MCRFSPRLSHVEKIMEIRCCSTEVCSLHKHVGGVRKEERNLTLVDLLLIIHYYYCTETWKKPLDLDHTIQLHCSFSTISCALLTNSESCALN